MDGHLLGRQNRRYAGVGVGEHLCPLVAGAGEEDLGEPGAQGEPAGPVELARQAGRIEGEPGEEREVELGLERSPGRAGSAVRCAG